jgi:hypothetical protein
MVAFSSEPCQVKAELQSEKENQLASLHITQHRLSHELTLFDKRDITLPCCLSQAQP